MFKQIYLPDAPTPHLVFISYLNLNPRYPALADTIGQEISFFKTVVCYETLWSYRYCKLYKKG